jgi:F-type H+-transporting ATPase subunit a
MLLFSVSNLSATEKPDGVQKELQTSEEVNKNISNTGEAHTATTNEPEGGEVETESGEVSTPAEIEAYMQHHLADSHDFSLFSYTDDAGERKHIGLPLPIIVYTSQGVKMFLSSEFHHNDDGKVIVEKDGVKLAKIHGKIYELNAGQNAVAFDEHHHATNAQKVLDFSITKTVIGMLLTGLLLLLGFGSLAKSYKKGSIPTGVGRFLEPLVIYVRDEIAIPNIGSKHYRKFMGFLLSLFFFIWLLNILGLTPLGFNVTGQIAFTACLALFTFFIIQFSANKDYWKHIFWMPGVPAPMKLVLAPIELIGLIVKPFTLMIRLFANITAGHSVLMGIIAVIFLMKNTLGVTGGIGVSLVLGIFIFLIELLVAFLQAYIFTMLSSLFIGMAVQDHEHEHDHH